MSKHQGSHAKFLNINSLAWVTDPHFEFLDEARMNRFCFELKDQAAEGILITGDISNGSGISQAVTMLSQIVQKPIFFVLGNHDRYESSFARTEMIVEACVRNLPNLYRLTGREVIRIAPGHALIGVDGWADGLAGSGCNTAVRINDFPYIYDFQELSDDNVRFDFMLKLARKFTETLRPTLEKALANFRSVLLATHVPPFSEAAWHEGRPSEPDFLPFFSSPTLGDMLTEVAQKYPDRRLRVLCGHTHGQGSYSHKNIIVDTGGATYGQPRIGSILRF
jgi:predicted MPP superfamily phosphohydrolase